MRKDRISPFCRSWILLFTILFSRPTAQGQAVDAALEMPSGLFFGPWGSLSAQPQQVAEGRISMIGQYEGVESYSLIMVTNSVLVRLRGPRTYTVRFSYRILKTPDKGFSVGFFPTIWQGAEGPPLSKEFSGKAGDRGSVALTSALKDKLDYQVAWHIVGKGAIAIDTISIEEHGATAPLFTADFEAAPLSPGLVDVKIEDVKTFPLGDQVATIGVRSASVFDLNGDGRGEAVLTTSGYPGQPLQPVIVLSAEPGASVVTDTFFPRGAPCVRSSCYTYYHDLNRDGRMDLVFADAGLDEEPYTGSRLVIALRDDRGFFEDISAKIPRDLWSIRTYASAVGDIDRDGIPEVLIADQSRGTMTAAIEVKGNDLVVDRKWIPQSLWAHPGWLCNHIDLGLADLDDDGWQDLIVGGSSNSPTVRIAFGSKEGFTAKNTLTLPDGVFGHFNYEDLQRDDVRLVQGADVSLVVADFDRDGKKDIFLIQQQNIHYKPGAITDTAVPDFLAIRERGGSVFAQNAVRILKNLGGRRFIDLPPEPSGFLGRRLYFSLVPADLNQDGYMDIVGGFGSLLPYETPYGTTVFLNNRVGGFRILEGERLFPRKAGPGGLGTKQMGVFLPTSIEDEIIEGLFVAAESNGRSASLIVRKAAISVNEETWETIAPGFP